MPGGAAAAGAAAAATAEAVATTAVAAAAVPRAGTGEARLRPEGGAGPRLLAGEVAHPLRAAAVPRRLVIAVIAAGLVRVAVAAAPPLAIVIRVGVRQAQCGHALLGIGIDRYMLVTLH